MDAGKVMFYSTIMFTVKKPAPDCRTAVFELCPVFSEFYLYAFILTCTLKVFFIFSHRL
jgi:hypothetical protein